MDEFNEWNEFFADAYVDEEPANDPTSASGGPAPSTGQKLFESILVRSQPLWDNAHMRRARGFYTEGDLTCDIL